TYNTSPFRILRCCTRDLKPPDIRMQGSGLISSGGNYPYIQYDWIHHKYAFFSCPTTKNGRCATAGESVAVDPDVIPMSTKHQVFGNISIDGVGDRTAEDGGKRIGGYHIDLFYGRTADDYLACKQFGVQQHNVTFLSYGH
ncbi:MAG: 3D domain-containing protein, partial [Minisyncoccia bacterium]